MAFLDCWATVVALGLGASAMQWANGSVGMNSVECTVTAVFGPRPV